MKFAVNIDGWSQMEKNLLAAMVNSLLFKAGIPHRGVMASNVTGEVEVIDGPDSIAKTITAEAILAENAAQAALRAAAAAAEAADYSAAIAKFESLAVPEIDKAAIRPFLSPK